MWTENILILEAIRNSIRNWEGGAHVCEILTTNMAFCMENLSKVEFKDNELDCLAVEI